MLFATQKRHYLPKSEKRCPKNRTTNELHKRNTQTQILPQNTTLHHVMMILGHSPAPLRHFDAPKPLHGGLPYLANLNHRYLNVYPQNATTNDN